MSNVNDTLVRNIGPKALAEGGTPDGPQFALSTMDWAAIQAYVYNGKALPWNETLFRESLGPGAPKDLSDFIPLIDAYDTIYKNCNEWSETTFPSTVKLADDVYGYGKFKAPTYYQALLTQAEALVADPNDAKAKAILEASLKVLQDAADAYRGRADKVFADLNDFADRMTKDLITLQGKDDKGGLWDMYDKKYGKTSKEVQDLLEEMKVQSIILQAENAKYEYDVTVAATTPTYAWIFPFGTIAAGVVAGLYGKKATDALDKARAAQKKIDLMQEKMQADTLLMLSLSNTKDGIKAMAGFIEAAIPAVQKIQGAWGAIAGDLKFISELIDSDIRKVPPVIMNLGIEEAIDAWEDVAKAADSYRHGAYIKVDSSVDAAVQAHLLFQRLSEAPRRGLSHA